VLARKILKKINNKTPKKGYALFETGYGPSGLPHIGTFGEVVRTLFVKHAFECLAPNIPTKLICVSDDMDGLRKVPSNIPNQNQVEKYLKQPLTSVIDPFEETSSYGEYMNMKLKSFLDFFSFDYEFISATENYKSGKFNNTMLLVAKNYEQIMKIMLPTLGEDRRKTYSPFMPIDSSTNHVLENGVKSIDAQKNTLQYADQSNQEQEISIENGCCKLQWKVDFGARWFDFGVDFEIFGKDHLANEKIYKSICKSLGGTPPVTFCYEMFLSEDGAKISKSSGNGISVEDWLKYAPKESLALYMFQKPQTAKRLHFDVIPKAMDEYLSFLKSYHKATQEDQKISNPVFHIHFSNVPNNLEFDINYSLLINLASACNPENEDILWEFIEKYQKNLDKNNSPILSKMVKCAINYYNDFIKPNKHYHSPSHIETKAILQLSDNLKIWKEQNEPNNNLSNVVFDTARENGYDKKTMKNWFNLLYKTLLGQNEGPRINSFIEIYGIDNFISLVQNKLKNNHEKENSNR
jgi:lysyl-tRNA synthetase class 1